MAVITAYYALGTGISNTGAFLECTSYTRSATNLSGTALSGLTETISTITAPTGPTGTNYFYGAWFDSLTGGNLIAYWQWNAPYIAVGTNFPGLAINVTFNTYLTAALNLGSIGGAGSSGSEINAGAQIGTLNGQPLIAGTKLGIAGSSLVVKSFANVTGQQTFPNNVNVILQGTGQLLLVSATGITGGTTRTQVGATALTAQFNRVDTSTAVAAGTNLGDGVALPAAAAGLEVTVWNNTVNSIKVYGAGSDTVNAMTSTVGVLLHAGALGTFHADATGAWIAWSDSPYTGGYTALTNTTNAVLTSANMNTGTHLAVVNMTGTLGSGQTLTLPTVALMVAGMHMPRVGKSYVLRVINTGVGAFSWTVTTSTGWTLTAGGTMTVAQNTSKDFLIQFQSLTAATLQDIGMVSTGVVT